MSISATASSNLVITAGNVPIIIGNSYGGGTHTTTSAFSSTATTSSFNPLNYITILPSAQRIRRDSDLNNSISDLALKEWLFYALSNKDNSEEDIFDAIDQSIIVLQESTPQEGYRIVQTRDSMDKLSIALKKLVLQEGTQATLTLPDGSILKLNADASYTIEDAHCQIKYRANRIRDYNKFIGGSDLLEEFLGFLKEINLTKEQALNEITIKHFIEWLVVQAAKEDGDDVPDYYPSEQKIIKQIESKHRCKWCHNELPESFRQEQLNFCNGNHMNLYMEQLAYKNHKKNIEVV